MESLPLVKIHTDGASRGNPGEAAFSFVIQAPDDKTIEEAGCLGRMTNNQAEYVALIRALRRALELNKDLSVLVHSDSELMVKQMNGQYRVKDGDLLGLYREARELSEQFTGGVRIVHVRRAQNKRADALCNEVLDARRKGAESHGTTCHERLSDGVAPRRAPASGADKVTGGLTPRRASTEALVPETDKKPLTVAEEALTCLRDAEAAWRRGDEVPSAETVWRWLIEILARHGVTATAAIPAGKQI